MQETLFEKIINELAIIDFDGRISYHFYGEPLLDKRLPRFVSETRRRVPKSTTEIYSNGDFLTLELFATTLPVAWTISSLHSTII
jgi:2-deoxy-scyllo-inosamine dehydrogenase (SAM-dependent)/8-amino-3,8-dideoxy-alpha-D-manno-octulosonate transaminase